jgi:hypothetical protein
VNFQQGNQITRIQHSACQSEPAGRECQTAKLESSRAANLHTTCVPFHKAGYPCPKPGSQVATRHPAPSGFGSERPPAVTRTPDTSQAPLASHEHTEAADHHVAAQAPRQPHHAPSEPEPIPVPSSPEPLPLTEPETPVEPGAFGDTKAPEVSGGVKACVNVAVSACVGAGADSAPHVDH